MVHLHVHSDFSLLDGMCQVEELAVRAHELGQQALACTDHGSTSGLYEFQKACEAQGIKPILGTEFYIEVDGTNKNGHLIVLAKNNEGLKNIYELQELAYTTNFKRKPRVNFNMLREHSDGLIVLSACLAGRLSKYLMDGKTLDAIAEAKQYKELFGDDYYIEIQSNSLELQKDINLQLINIAQYLDIKVVLTNDTHYVYKEDSFPHEVLLAMQTGKKMDDENRFKFPSNDFWLKSKQEMIDSVSYLNDYDIEKYLQNTIEVAEKCNARIEKGNFLPEFYNLNGRSSREVLVEYVKEGIAHKEYTGHNKDIQREINIIDDEGLCDYFLIVQDYINAAREADILVGDGRGSGAGSKSGYVLDIHRVDPAKYNLLFDRFMAPGRHPDIDVDFSDQEFVYEYLCSKYGIENVAHVNTNGTMTPKAVVRKVLSAFGYSSAKINMVNSNIMDNERSIQNAINNSPSLRRIASELKKEFDVIKRLEGTISHEGTHAGGIIIQKDLSSKLPVRVVLDKEKNRTHRIVCFDKYALEELGHWKFDVLGLETLPIIKRCIDNIKINHDIDVDLYNIDYDDPKVYEALSSGDASGIFQLANQASKLMEQHPNNFLDLIAINALIRPGVGDWNEYINRRNGKEWSIYEPRSDYMSETSGTMTYQEQFLLDAHILCGWEISFADKHLRKNKDIRNDAETKALFIADGIDRGHSEHVMNKVWGEIENAVDGGYSFNKAHSTSYAMLSFQTAWLKTYYPTEFYASLLTSNSHDKKEVAKLIAECKRRGIKILPPDINISDDSFTPTKDGITYQITAISNVGSTSIKDILRIRPIKSLSDLLERRTKKNINGRTTSNLIKSGCLDAVSDVDRGELMYELKMYGRTKTQKKNNLILDKDEYNDKIKLDWEKETLGLYLAEHPMDAYSFKPLDSFNDNGSAFIGGEIVEVKEATQKNEKKMAFMTLDTGYDLTRVLIFASYWGEELKETLTEGKIILARGRRSGDSLLYDSMEVLNDNKREL